MRQAIGALILALTISVPARAETVDVKYVGKVDLSVFNCTDVTRSSFVHRVCHDEANQKMVILLKRTYYQYCRIGAPVVQDLLAAESIGRFYNSQIKSSSNDGLYDCRA